ncbi:MAG: hypothetical protein ACR2F2_02395 [Pyrinomonadaceae bacterium]
MKKIISIAVFILIFTVAVFPQKSKYVGYKHKGVTLGETLSNGVKSISGGLTSNNKIGVSRYTKGKKYMLWLEEVVSRDASGVPTWVVRNVLTFDNLKKNQEFHFSYNSPCKLNGKDNVDLIVKTELQPQTKKYKILEAWKANTKTLKFEEIDTKNVQCKTF